MIPLALLWGSFGILAMLGWCLDDPFKAALCAIGATFCATGGMAVFMLK